MRVGSGKVSDLKFGSSDVARAYLGGACVWPPDSVPLDWPLRTSGVPRQPALAWWRADWPETLTLSGGKVVEWRDMVSGIPMTQGVDARRPTYSPTSFGGTPGVKFDSAAQQFLALNSSPWPIDRDSCYLILVVDQLAPPSDTANKTMLAYGDTWTGQRKFQRRVVLGYDRSTLTYGNGFTEYAHMHEPVMFHGRHAVISFVQDVSASLGVDGVFAGLMTLALRTVGGRTRIGADALPTPGEFANCIIRDVIIGDPTALFGNHWLDLQKWILRRRKIDFYDDFTRREEDLEASPNWSQISGQPGALRVVNNRLVQEIADFGSMYLSPDVGSPDQYVQVKIVAPTNAASSPLVVLRAQDESNFACGLQADGGYVYLYTSVGGTWQYVGIAGPYKINDIFRLDARGTQVRLYQNGELVSGPHTVSAFASQTRSGVVSSAITVPFIEDYENAL